MKVPQIYIFGEFTLSLEEKTLRRGEENVGITPKMFELLGALVRNNGRIVEKEYLLRTVWPDSFVEEGNITFNIRQLRKVLGDDAQSPIYIETIPRRGYRFVAKVTRPEPEKKIPAAPEKTAANVSTMARNGSAIQAPPLRNATSSLLTGTPRVTLTRITASNGLSCPV